VTDYLAIAALIFWPVIPLFWIPVHFATGFFKKLGLLTYAMPLFTWLPLAYLIFQNRTFLISYKTDLPMIVNIIGMILLIFGALLHMWTAKLLGVGIIGVPEIFIKIKENILFRCIFYNRSYSCWYTDRTGFNNNYYYSHSSRRERIAPSF
jgi:hypothetical protein